MLALHRARLGRSLMSALLTLALAGCAGDSQPAVEAAEPAQGDTVAFNQVDVDFAVHLSQHHAQTLTMAELARSRARSAKVKTIAARIEAVQAPRLDQIAEWLRTWAAAGATMPGHGIGHDEPGPGSLPSKEIDRLGEKSARAFDRTFLTLLARHHTGAMELTGDVLAGGISPDARGLAEQVLDTQRAQMAEVARARDAG